MEIQKTLQNDISKKKREIDKLRTDLARKELELQQASANKVQVSSGHLKVSTPLSVGDLVKPDSRRNVHLKMKMPCRCRIRMLL